MRFDLLELIGTDRDGLANALKAYEAIIRTGEWRPLADHFVALLELALRQQAKLLDAEASKLADPPGDGKSVLPGSTDILCQLIEQAGK
jgi:hypothetical protein